MDSSENTSAKFICEICENGYFTNTYKEQHLLLVHGEQKKYPCNVCNKIFRYSHHLKYHISKMHNGEHFND